MSETTISERFPGLYDRRARALARAITTIERGGTERDALIREVYGRRGNARIMGFTGPPGAGKSTLVDRFARLCRAADQTVGILAVDPTSPFTGGALLGDRIRMQELYTDPEVFIRSMATRGAMGGLARATRDAVDLLDAVGFDWVLVETVGVGQDEVDVVRTVDTVAVITLPGLGDEIQAIKAGIMEIADVFVINKADRPGVDRTRRDLESMLAMGGHRDWTPPIVQTVASQGEGLEELHEKVGEHRQHLADSGELDRRRFHQLRLRVETILKARVLEAADAEMGLETQLEEAFGAGDDPYTVADRLFEGVVRRQS
ncbi:MAG: methylmalonyl Co-A mutase-associated GTPase MeaB [Acidobacteriota bacterium]